MLVHTNMKIPDSKVHGANLGPIWGRQEPGGPHVGSINIAIWESTRIFFEYQWTEISLLLHLNAFLPQMQHCYKLSILFITYICHFYHLCLTAYTVFNMSTVFAFA